MENYNHKQIEEKWRKKWQETELYKTRDSEDKEKYYVLDMFPYPSGAGLHVGHPKGYIATDAVARMKMLQGYNVLHPMGWDAFGLPAENFAIKNKIHPRVATEKNIATFKAQLEKLGFTYDWSREVNTTDPEFFKWTQWIFLEMFKRGLAYESFEPIIWCPSCQTGLAMEDLENGKCERCGSEVERKPMRQWVLKITAYAERLLNDLEKLPQWEESIKEMQRNWIGMSEGATVKFQITNHKSQITNKFKIQNSKLFLEVFTTRPDTLFGCTYMVVAPEHPLIENLKSQIKNYDEVYKYIVQSKKKSDLERTDLAKEKTGVKIEGLVAVNPVNNEEIPIFVADYVLAGYGTGAIMAVPAHDERDWEFAKKYNLPIIKVVEPPVLGSIFRNIEDVATGAKLGIKVETECWTQDGMNINSDFLNGLETKEAKEKIIKWLEENSVGKRAVNYKLRDWVFSRQRYWGEPIPLIFCDECAKKANNKVFILHGWEDNSQSGFIPSLKADLTDKGYEVLALDLPNTNAPDFDIWYEYAESEIKKNNLDNFILIGHSMGALLALKLAEKHQIRKLALIAPVGPIISDEYFEQFKNDLSAEEMNIFKKYQDRKLDVQKIKDNAEIINFIFGKKDKWITEEVRAYYVENFKNKAVIQILKETGHMSKSEGIKELKPLEEMFNKYSPTEAGWHALADDKLPLTLPEVEHYEPSGTGESPLAAMPDWVNVKCPKCGGPAKRETNTMPQWAGSSWYYLRYINPHNDQALADKAKEKYWSPVDLYVGGAEHATRHLIYARFWHKFLYDIGAVNFDEPFTRLRHVGLILAEDGRKMGKRWGNVINPDEVVDKYGADAMRVYEMFMGPFSQPVAWSTNGLKGARGFLEKVWRLQAQIDTNLKTDSHKLDSLVHKTVKKVGEDIEEFKFNTAISAMMILVNEMSGREKISLENYEALLKILAPFAPHIAEELWEQVAAVRTGSSARERVERHSRKVAGETPAPTDWRSIFQSGWPQYDSDLIKDEIIKLVIQINSKVRDSLEAPADISDEDAKKLALESEKIQKWIKGKEIAKVVYVKRRLVNIVVK